MRNLFLVAIVLATCVFAAPSASANQTYCPPEYPNCNSTGGEGGTLGSTPYPTGGGGGNGTYEKSYGTDYAACTATGSTMCLRCSYVYTKKAYACTGNNSAGYCGCTEKYENYILKSCTSRGSCDYF